MQMFGVTTAYLAAAILTATPMIASADRLDGDPVTAATLVDVQEMIRIVDSLDAAVDAKDWTLARSLFIDEIQVDFASLTGVAPATIPADALIAGWAGNLKASKTSFHLRGNHRVSFEDATTPVMLSHGYAWNRLEAGALPENGGDPLWHVWGNYEHRFVKTETGWRLSGLSFFATAQSGNFYVRDTIPEE